MVMNKEQLIQSYLNNGITGSEFVLLLTQMGMKIAPRLKNTCTHRINTIRYNEITFNYADLANTTKNKIILYMDKLNHKIQGSW